MPQPTLNQVHVNKVLTNISIAYQQADTMFISAKVFPIVPVDKQSDLYWIWGKNDWFRDEAQERAPSTQSVGSGYTLSTDSYNAKVYAFHKDVSDMINANADGAIADESAATRFVTRRLMLRQELQWVSDYFKSGVWGTDVTPAALWSDYVNSDPIGDVDTAKTKILSTTGFEPNTLVLGYNVWIALKNHPDIVARYQYTQAGVITEEMVARLFNIDRLLIAKAVKATNKEGQTGAYGFAYGKHAFLCYAAPNASLMEASAGYMFMWRGVSRGLGETTGVKSFRMEEIESTRVEGQIAFADKVVATDLGYFFANVVA